MAELFSFGAWIRRRRKALDLTREALAQQVGCAISTIKKLESDERRPSRELAKRLAHYLQLTDAEQAAFLKAARAELSPDRLPRPLVALDLPRAPPPQNARLRLSMLPVPLTPLVGRTHIIARIHTLLTAETVRLVTLSGPPGIGKTRLALEAARVLQPAFGHHVIFVPLSPIRDPQLVLPAIAQRVGISETSGQQVIERLAASLQGKSLLLVLDNFEQVIQGAVLLAELLERVPRLKLLVTSRIVLSIRGEKQISVPPLRLPEATHQPPPEQISEYEAVRLFVERVRDVSPEFCVSAENATTILAICRRLDGLPLAIELAAARCKLLSPELLLERLSHPLAVLTGGPRDLPAHQQTLRDAIAWSYTLLPEAEQRLFRRLAVFVGGSTIALAEAVCEVKGAVGGTVLDGLAALLDHSLLQEETPVHEEREPRLTMLESIREYALEQLEASGEAAAMRQRHAEVFLALVEQAAPLLIGPEQRHWLDRLEAEHENLRAALHWTTTSGTGELALRLSSALWQFWYRRGYWRRGYHALSRALAAAAQPRHSRSRAKALNAAGMLAVLLWDPVSLKAARAHFEESLVIGSRLEDEQVIAWALHGLALVAVEEQDLNTALRLFEQSLTCSLAAADRFCSAWTLSCLAELTTYQGSSALAQTRAAESMTLFQQLGDPFGQAYALNILAVLAYDRSDYETARDLFQQALQFARAVNASWSIAVLLNNLGDMLYVQGDFEQAIMLQRECLVVGRELGRKLVIAMAILGIARALLAQGNLEDAAAHFKESLAIFNEMQYWWDVAYCLEGLARVAGLRGQSEPPAHLLGVVLALRERVGWALYPAARDEHEQLVALLRARLGEPAFEAALLEGRALTFEAALVLAHQI